MSAFLGFLSFVLFIALIVGLVKPTIVLRWSKNPTRLKVFGYWILSFFITGTIAVLMEDTQSNVDLAQDYIAEGKYEIAIKTLNDISEEDTLYNQAQILIHKADSLNYLREEEKKLAKEEASKKELEEKRKKAIEYLETEIKSINEGVDFSTYRGAIDVLQMELLLFSAWANIITESEKLEDPKINSLVKQLRLKVARLQTKEFPIMRKEYTKLVGNQLWENDIDVSANGTGRKYINFSGRIFAANKNKKNFQTEIHEILTMFRFKQSRYRWYKGADEYTYYNIYEGKDTDLVAFTK
ncbi:MAG: hypothetical protein N4A49_15150 [Marinifilaceae bacterium]|jgi:hypothetical protein|nr:hypothetical protein [Marinifilaceae bacterium]